MRGNGQGTAYKRGKWWIAEMTVGYDPETHRPLRKRKGGFKTKRDALEYLPTLKTTLPEKANHTVSHYYNLWYNKTTVSESKRKAYKIAWKKWQPIHHMDVKALDIATLQTVLDENTHTYYPARDMRQLLSNIYKLAVADQVVSVVLSSYLVLPKLEEKEADPFTNEELSALWALYNKDDPFVGYILLMIYTGMMPGELLKLRKDMIDWDRQEIIGAGIKTNERKRKSIVLADFITPVLKNLCDSTKGEKVIHIVNDNFYKQYYETLERAQVRRLVPYSCRHTTATALALGNNVTPLVIQRIMRHAKFATTQRYIHTNSAFARQGVETLRPQ